MNGPSYRPNKRPGRVVPDREHERQVEQEHGQDLVNYVSNPPAQ